jgi:hypothetical protein
MNRAYPTVIASLSSKTSEEAVTGLVFLKIFRRLPERRSPHRPVGITPLPGAARATTAVALSMCVL